VRYFAERMGLQTLQKRASDLLNPFLGGTERNIANAFAEARDADAFLVFDEADTSCSTGRCGPQLGDQPGQRDAHMDGTTQTTICVHDQSA
jgi:hypothetical protein